MMNQTAKQDNTIQPDMNIPTYQNDEIDLRELVKVIWAYKWLTALLCTLAFIASVFYVTNAQEWWVAEGKLIEPQLNDVAHLYAQSEQVSGILQASRLSTGREIDQFVELFEPEALFKIFMNSFNSSLNKKAFVANNPVFLKFLQENEIEVPSNDSSSTNPQYLRSLESWVSEINGSYDIKIGEMEVSLRSTTKESSSQLLNQYIENIAQKVRENQFEKFILFIDASKKSLQLSLEMSEKKAEKDLSLLLQQSEYAYQIAKQAKVIEYNPNLNKEKELFQINLGEKVLKEKVEVLKSIKDLSMIEPLISHKRITLAALNALELTEDTNFSPFRYLDNVEPPLNRAAPKRALIVILATLLAGMLAIFLALIHYFMTRKEYN